MRKILIALAALGLLLVFPMTASAVTEEFSDVGPVDLSGGLNAGERVQLGSVDLGEGEWTVISSVRLSVGDPEDGKPADEQKNSQGCGLYADGEQVGGAGGSSSLWTSVEGGKEVTFTEWWDGIEFHPEVVLEGPVTLVLECFIDASHSGVTEGDRSGMVATDISISATQPDPEPEPCEFDESLTAEDPECVEPDPEPSPTPSEEPSEEPSGTESPDATESPSTASVGTESAAGKETLPKTGPGWGLLAISGAVLLGSGAGLLWFKRKYTL